jgi:hypothetical protein
MGNLRAAQPHRQPRQKLLSAKSKEGLWDAMATDPVALATLALVLVTGFMTWAVFRQVNMAREEFATTYRPKIRCMFFESFTGVGDDPDGVEITYVNEGPSPATMIEIGKTIVPTKNLRPGVMMDVVPLNRKRLASGQKDKSGIGHLAVTVAKVIASAPSLGPITPTYCIGYIAYEDERGLRRETGFCRSFDAATNCWLPVESEYEYSY